jgi:acetyl esterase/lipase
MKRIPTLGIVWLAVVLATAAMSAQDLGANYAANVTKGIVYGTAPRFDGGTDTLKLDLYTPVGDANTQRPLMIWIHGGGFVQGNRTEMDAACRAFTRLGFACATVSYRLGFYPPPPLSNPFAADSVEVIRAVYRAVQDVKGAMRYLAGRAATDSTDVSRVVLAGVSAGAITAIHAAFADDDERPECTRSAPALSFPGQTPIQRGDMGSFDGTLHTDKPMPRIAAVVNMLGAIDDTTWIDADESVPMYSYHQTGDPIVGCNKERGLYNFPLNVGGNYPYLFGTCLIERRMQGLFGSTPNRKTWIHDGPDHDLHDATAIIIDGAVWLVELLKKPTTVSEEPLPRQSIALAPQPADDEVRIRADHPFASLTVVDVHGRTLRSVSVGARDYALSLQGLASGMYMLRVDGTALPLVVR